MLHSNECFHSDPKHIKTCMHVLSCIHLFVTLQTAAHQAALSGRFSRQEHWSGLPFPPPGDLPDPGIEPVSPALQVDSLPLSHQGSIKMCIFPTVDPQNQGNPLKFQTIFFFIKSVS